MLQDKVAIVTGSGNGIGRAVATRFAGEGAAVTIAELEEGPGRETAEAIAASGAALSSTRPTPPTAARCEPWSRLPSSASARCISW